MDNANLFVLFSLRPQKRHVGEELRRSVSIELYKWLEKWLWIVRQCPYRHKFYV